MSMTDQELAQHLGNALEALGRIKGCALAMDSLIRKELGDDYYTDEFNKAFDTSLGDAAANIKACFHALTGPVELEASDEK